VKIVFIHRQLYFKNLEYVLFLVLDQISPNIQEDKQQLDYALNSMIEMLESSEQNEYIHDYNRNHNYDHNHRTFNQLNSCSKSNNI
jgi:hypothetical protein